MDARHWRGELSGNLNDLGKHEILGHGAQGAEMGDMYTPVYLFDWAAAWLVQDYLASQGWDIELHDAHPMEIDANLRAGITPVAPSLRRRGIE